MSQLSTQNKNEYNNIKSKALSFVTAYTNDLESEDFQDKGILPPEKKKLLEVLISKASPEKENIILLTVFMLDNLEYSSQIAEVICRSFTSKNTFNEIIGKIYVFTDILYNTLSPAINASAYKTAFVKWLPMASEVICSVYATFKQEEAEIFRVKLLKVFKSWKEWNVYSDVFIDGLESTIFRERLLQENMRIKDFYETIKRQIDKNMDSIQVETECKKQGIYFVKGKTNECVEKLEFCKIYQQYKSEDKIQKLISLHKAEGVKFSMPELSEALYQMNYEEDQLQEINLEFLIQKLSAILVILQESTIKIDETNIDGHEFTEEDYVLYELNKNISYKDIDGVNL